MFVYEEMYQNSAWRPSNESPQKTIEKNNNTGKNPFQKGIK